MHRTSADLDARDADVREKLDASPTRPCATSTGPTTRTVPAGFTASSIHVTAKYWDGNPAPRRSTAPSCTAATDKGAQQLTVTLTRASDGQKDSLVIVKRDEVQP